MGEEDEPLGEEGEPGALRLGTERNLNILIGMKIARHVRRRWGDFLVR